MAKPIFLDNHSTTQVDPRVFEKMKPFFMENFGNASSIDHTYGAEAMKSVSHARYQISSAMNAKDPDGVIFTSGATESDNLAIIGTAHALKNKGKHIITSSTEHKAVLEACQQLEREGYEITYLPVNNDGEIQLADLEQSIRKDTILISLMAANNEVGTIAPIKAIGKIAKKNSVIFHTDAAQAFGRIRLDVNEMNIDLMSISGHKIYGPKGIGALYINTNNLHLRLVPIIHGGGQEFGYRSGTLNTPGIVGLGAASEIAQKEMREENLRLTTLRDILLTEIAKKVDVKVNGNPSEKLTNNLNLYFPGVEAKALINDAKGIAISAGSACTSREVKPSHVLSAMGFPEERIHSSIRIGLGRFTTENEVRAAAKDIVASVVNLKNL